MYKKPINSALFFLILFLASCQTDPKEILPTTDKIQEGNPDPQKLGELKDWFGQHEPELNQQAEGLTNARQNNLDRFMVPFVEKLPDWHQVYSFRFPDGRQVYEVALDNKELVVPRPVRDSLGDEGLGDKIIQNLLFIEGDGGWHVMVVRYYPASNGDLREFGELNYDKLSDGWSGQVDLYGFGEDHVRNYTVVDGYTVKASTYRPAGSVASAYTQCHSYWMDFPYYNIGRFTVVSTRSVYVTVCDDAYYPSLDDLHTLSPTSQSGGSGSGGVGGSGTDSNGCPAYYGSLCYHTPGAGNPLPSPKKPSISQLKQQIANRPFALIDKPCDIVKAWIATAKHTVGQTQLNKLKTIAKQSTYYTGPTNAIPITATDVANVQNINNAYSSVVNMDYFPVTVTQLPMINGKRATPEQFLGHIRTNINSFVNTTYSEFAPYNAYGTNDTQLWNSSNPLGAVVGIDIQGPDNGSVIVSSYSSSKWTFTTVHDPKYGDHPVSGNRDFGYVRNANGTYTFYTRGVDRLTDWEGTKFQEYTNFPFSSADNLWKSFQSKVASYANSNGGKASVSSTQIERPNWIMVKDVIEGKKPLNALNKNCN